MLLFNCRQKLDIPAQDLQRVLQSCITASVIFLSAPAACPTARRLILDLCNSSVPSAVPVPSGGALISLAQSKLFSHTFPLMPPLFTQLSFLAFGCQQQSRLFHLESSTCIRLSGPKERATPRESMPPWISCVCSEGQSVCEILLFVTSINKTHICGHERKQTLGCFALKGVSVI